MRNIILASASAHRADMLNKADIAFKIVPSSLDERALEAPLAEADVSPADRAEILAEAKAISVSEQNTGTHVIGCDQILALDGEVLHKVRDMEEARRRLLALSGNTHILHSAVVLAKDGETIWRHVVPCAMTMRDLDPAEIGRYLSAVGDAALSSVGCYQIEGRGVRLFDQIEGDLFSIIGLPLLALLKALREHGALDDE